MILNKTTEVILAEIYSKTKSTYVYLNYNSENLSHVRDNVAINLGKRIVFVSCPKTMKNDYLNLEEIG